MSPVHVLLFFVVQKGVTPGSTGRRVPSAEHAGLPLGDDVKRRELEEERRKEYNELIQKVLHRSLKCAYTAY